MRKTWKRGLALSLALTMTVTALVPAAGAAAIPAACDEAYYATLDYYGGVREASVVKSYRLNGAKTITDHGAYDEVVNLTDGLTPTVSEDTVTFELGEDAPEKFYFEGKTTRPFEDLPWSIAVSYRLNGAPILAEELGGKTGLVEICLDVLPNAAAPAYSRDNLVLTAAAAFNDDDIVSLEAPGAEVQLVGNLRTVIFAVLPGEEQHFVIRVGSEDFSFSGLILLAVPATLQQLEKVADIKEAKEKGEDSLEAINDSLDVILNTLEGMSGSLNTTANGLDQLSGARSTVSKGKGNVYDNTDRALGSMDAMAEALGAMDRYTVTASQAITELNTTLNSLNTTAQGLVPELENARRSIAAIQSDARELKALLGDVESYNKKATDIAASLADETEELDGELEGMRFALDMLEVNLKNTKGVSPLKSSDLLGLLPKDQAEQMKEVLNLHSQYESYLSDNGLTEKQLSFRDFIVSAAYGQYRAAVAEQVTAMLTAAGLPAEQIPTQVEALLSPSATADVLTAAGITDPTTQAKIIAAQSLEHFCAATAISGEYLNKAQAADKAYQEFSAQLPMVDTVNAKIREVNALIVGITDPTARLVGELSDICELLGDTGTADDFHSLAGLCRDLLKTLKKHEGEGAALIEDMDEVGDLLSRITLTADRALGDVDSLTGILNTYEPELQAALTDLGTLSGTAQTTLRDTTAALGAMENLLRTAGPQLDAGTANSLGGLSQALRQATTGLEQTDTIRGAKTTIKDLMDDEWDAHSGQVDGLLNMDAGAVPVSMTDSRNPAPQSVQYVMRTQEIRVEEPTEELPEEQRVEKTTFWQRVADMFQGIWANFKRLLHIG